MKMVSFSKAAAAACVLVLAIGPARAVPQTAAEMRAACQPLIDDMEGRAYSGPTYPALDADMGFCAGAFDALLRWGRVRNGIAVTCAPDGVTLGQFILVFARYADRLPARLHEPWFGVAMPALIQAFPCPEPAPAGGRQ